MPKEKTAKKTAKITEVKDKLLDKPKIERFVQEKLVSVLDREFSTNLEQLEKNLNLKCFLVGGALRDLVLNCFDQSINQTQNQEQIHASKIKDFDFIVQSNLEPESNYFELFCEKLAQRLQAKLILLNEKHKTYRLLYAQKQFDFTQLAGSSLQEDLAKRDFSINAFAFEMQTKRLYDPQKGLTDLQKKIIKSIHEENLKVDPLRILRAYRLKAELNFRLEKETHRQLIENQKSIEIQRVSPERISSEFFKILDQKDSFSTLWEMFQDKVLFIILPELKAQEQIPPNDFHHLRLIEHTLELVKQIENNVRKKFPTEYLPKLDQAEIKQVKLSSLIKLGCLLHDISKPETWQFIAEENKHTFYNHDSLGAEKSIQICKRLCLPKQALEFVCLLVKFHLRPFSIAKIEEEPTLRAQRRLFLAFQEHYFPGLIFLCWADLYSISGIKVTPESTRLSENRLIKLLKNYELFLASEKQEPLLLKGEDLKRAIKTAKIRPSKKIQVLLTELRERQIEKKINDKIEAFNWFVKKASNL